MKSSPPDSDPADWRVCETSPTNKIQIDIYIYTQLNRQTSLIYWRKAAHPLCGINNIKKSQQGDWHTHRRAVYHSNQRFGEVNVRTHVPPKTTQAQVSIMTSLKIKRSLNWFKFPMKQNRPQQLPRFFSQVLHSTLRDLCEVVQVVSTAVKIPITFRVNERRVRMICKRWISWGLLEG